MEDQRSSSLVTEETTNIPDNDNEHMFTIPKLVHVLLETKCITKNLQESLSRNWHLALSDHSIIYHDKEEIDVFISEIAKSRHDFSGILSIYYCTSNVSIKMDIARLMYLWKFGGLSVVLGHPFNSIPTPAFANGTAVDYNADEFLWWFEQNDESSDTAQQQLLASAPEHPALYIAITHFIAGIDFISNCLETDVSGNCDYLYPGFLHNLYANIIMKYYTEDKNANNNEGKTRMINIASYLKSKITHIKDQSDPLLVHSDMKNNSNLLATDVFDDDRSTKQEYYQCNTMTQKRMINYKKNTTHNDVKDPSLSLYDVDVELLLEIVDLKHQNETKCPDGLIHIPSTYNPASIESNNDEKAKEGNGDEVTRRHIPKFIHMTSKTRCFSPEFVENINKWRNFEGYSFFIHDDNAVKRLFSSSDYSQKFPLLNEILSCVNSGAGLADVWRYLAIWEFGGIYTDIDNAPGSLFANGSVIEDYMDSFFEQEKGRFPSQYFFASAPRTPVMYMTLKSTIERLLDTKSIQNQYVPFVTGPGAVKSGVIRTIGNGYPPAGEYEGLGGRNVTIVGSPQMARRGHFVKRDSIKNKGPKFVKMNMKQYGRRNGNKTNSCLREIMENTETKTHN